RAIATDLRAPPLVLARRNIARSGVRDRVITIQSDGLGCLEGLGVDVVSSAGISGSTMVRLLGNAPRVLASLTRIVLQPNSDGQLVRAWARQSGWHLREEALIEERSRFFQVLAFEPGVGPDPAYDATGDDATALEVGPLLLARRDPTALRWCQWQTSRLGKLVDEGAHGLAPELLRWRRASSFLEGA
ncbi:MAG TPA: tRNA (adenine(22)-N(1))-methyltransferase TrmK, partial [Polyangiales bacterium]|nr:tRNA (adenine(22)-N(1))-methyltransferase TrmK [Polyangiales bacterium]